jgi:hypothetical protein
MDKILFKIKVENTCILLGLQSNLYIVWFVIEPFHKKFYGIHLSFKRKLLVDIENISCI